MKLRYPLSALALAVSFYGGMRLEVAHIQQTCEADSGATWLNGTPYLCFSQRQIEILRQQQRERGA